MLVACIKNNVVPLGHRQHVQRVHAAGVLYDLRKLGIADAILYKSGALTDAE